MINSEIILNIFNQETVIKFSTYRLSGSFYTDSVQNLWHDLIAWFCGGSRDYSYGKGEGYAFLTESGLDHFLFLTRQ